MKKLMLVVVALAFSLGALVGCGSPCDKAFDKYAGCLKEKGVSKKRLSKFKDKKSKWVGECKI